ncbi:hypothetical protein T440DRAFT_526311 [Plenodomus tracheiphilus IPT5]|uniref:VASt domain-containing protein n=1 Tax=Plenodomus tracheiphilus IPT5 TaxID=1408161 RepID=A0A6A7BBB7_9PLEO|nr:hypothetical protein T440DRAFT_526311 [Plenodomus tracheiphilus IPT5]
MASTERRRSIGSLFGKDNSLAAPGSRAASKGPASSTVSIASSDRSTEDLRKSTDGTRDRLRGSRTNSEDARSDASSSHPKRMTKLFKGRRKSKASRSHDDLALLDAREQVPPVPAVQRPGAEPRYQSDDSLGLAKSVASSLLTEESDMESLPRVSSVSARRCNGPSDTRAGQPCGFSAVSMDAWADHDDVWPQPSPLRSRAVQGPSYPIRILSPDSRSRSALSAFLPGVIREPHAASSSASASIPSSSSTPPPKRPGISPHQSHAGLLTLSSPLIASETIDSVDTAKHASLTDSATSAAEDAPAKHPKTVDIAANKRGVSPVGKLKDAFAPTRRSTSPKTAVETDGAKEPARPSTSGGSIGSLFGGKKRQDRVLDGPFHASPPQLLPGEATKSTTSPRGTAPKRIITQIPAAPPNLLDAPTTFITPPTPTDGNAASPTESTSSTSGVQHTAAPSNPNIVVSPSGHMISHRRVRSATNPPSKLSQSVAVPLTPHPEEAKTPGGTAVLPQSPGASGGFFASIFSAAQNAANNITDTIANNPASKQKGVQQTQKEEDTKSVGSGEEVIGPETADATAVTESEQRRPAVETLGSGNLSLAHLGITENNEITPMSSTTNVTMKADEASAKVEDMAAAQAVSAAYAGEKAPSIASERPRSLTAVSAQTNPGAATPPRQPEVTDSPAASSLQRQGSIRSRISSGRRRRHRGSSAATGTTTAGGPGASTTTLAPSAALNINRLNGTGFAVASPKRNRDFHALFKSVPEDDYLIEDYSAALQKEILLHGRLYVSEGHLCFSSNILGWVTNLVISFDEVVSVEKKSTAVVFPNAIVIQTLHARNVFASFLARDTTYDLIIGIWKISHPNLKSSLNGVILDGGTGDKTEKAESVGSEDGSVQDSEDEVYDEDAEDDDGMGSFTEAGEGSVAGSEVSAAPAEARKVSGAIAQAVGGGGEVTDAAKAATNGVASTNDFPGSTSHAPTECGDGDQHYDKLLIDTTIPAPLGKVYSLMFGPASGVFMRKWLIEDQKSIDLQMEDDKKGLGEDKKNFNYSYIKPLNAPVGPRQTKCNIAMTLEQFDLEKAVSVQCSTGTPDVPSGSIFLTKTRYCLMWGPGNSTRLIMTFTVEWSGKSWLRGPIEKGANDGQMSYATSITAALRTAVSASKLSGPLRVPGKPGAKGRKRSKTAILDEPATITAPNPSAQAKQSDWGLFDPIRSLLGPVADVLESLFTTQIIITFLGLLLIYAWFFRGASTAVGPNQWSATQRQVAYEEIWRHEESELWDWLEDRVALDRARREVIESRWGGEHQTKQEQKIMPGNMKERDVDEAIRVTEERLQVLKHAVQRERGDLRAKGKK